MRQTIYWLPLAAVFLLGACNVKQGVKDVGDGVQTGVQNVGEALKKAPEDVSKASNKVEKGIKEKD